MAEFMGYEVEIAGYEVVAQADSTQSYSGDDIALLRGPGPGMAAEFFNGRISPIQPERLDEGRYYTLREPNDWELIDGRWCHRSA